DCRSTPKLVKYAIGMQGFSDELPGGFIVNLEDVEQHKNRTKDDVCLDALKQLEHWGLIGEQFDSTFSCQKDKLLEDLKARLSTQ
ncbi:uncharacterized protein BO97DRAFT_347935, partial [Aspergillus homomorphus CBS 101889]